MPRKQIATYGLGGQVAMLVAVGVLTVSAPAAGAEPGLTAAAPAAGAVLDTAPAEVGLTFADDVQPELSHVTVLNAAGINIVEGEYQLPEPQRISMPVRIVAPGDYTVAYHVTFPDGTQVTGAHRFSVGTGVAPAPLDAAARLAVTEEVTEHAHTIDPLSAWLIVIDGVVLLGVLVLLLLRRPKQHSPSGTHDAGNA